MRTLVWLSTLAVFLLMVLGGVVSSTESGLGCGPDWPLCQGRLIPPFDQPEVFIEWFHRLVAALTGFLVVGAAIASWRAGAALAGAALGLLIAQVLLGALTVRMELPPVVSTAHLATGTALVGVLVGVWALAGRRGRGEAFAGLPSGLLWTAVFMTYAQMVLGAYMRHINAGLACPDAILCLPATQWPVLIHFLHRLTALVVLGVVHAAGGRVLRTARTPGPKVAALTAMILVVVQIVLGVLSVSTRLFPHVTTTHLAVALLLLGALVYLAIRASAATTATASQRAG
jgi:heme A synthase